MRRRGLLVAGVTLGLAGLAVSVVGVARQFMPRSFSTGQREQIMAWEVGKRWRTWPAGQIFPRSVGYLLPGSAFGGGQGLALTARRVGVARQATCRAAVSPPAASALVKHGCAAVLRATYEDETKTLAVTVGVAVLPSAGAAAGSSYAMPVDGTSRPGVRAVPFPHTLAGHFGSGKRLSWHEPKGPYLVLATVGYADGRPWLPASHDEYTRAEMLSLAYGVGHWVASHLGGLPPPPKCPGSPAC